MNHRGRTRASLLLALVLSALLVAFNPTSAGEQLRAMLGLRQDLTFTITDPGSAGFEPALLQAGGREPVTWNPCRDIPYVVNPEGAPAGYETVLAEAIADIEAASGLHFRDEGVTDDRSFEDRTDVLGSPQPVLIGWATPAELPGLAGEVAGLGGAEAVGTSPGHLTYVTGMVALDRDAFAEIGGRDRGSELQRAVVEHELGHVVGLGHVDDPAQLMHAETTDRSRLGAGDLAGLALLGSGSCR